MKVKKCERLKLIRLIRSCEGYSNKQIRDKIKEVFNVNYNISNIRYLVRESYKEEWIAKLKRDNEIIKAWNNSETEIKKEPIDKLYAENLFKLFNGKINNDEFLKEVC